MSTHHEQNYRNVGLEIPLVIYKDDTVRGLAKNVLTLIKKFTNEGIRQMPALTREMSNILHTTEKDILYHLGDLDKRGHIKLVDDPTSPTKLAYRYTYKRKDQRNTTSTETKTGLF